MNKWFESKVAWRYIRSGSGQSFITFISNVSIAGIALGVAVLIIVMSVMNGFEAELRERLLSVASHATVSGPDNRLANWLDIDAVARDNTDVIATAPFIEGQGIFLNGKKLSGAIVRGILPERETAVSELPSLNTAAGALQAGKYQLVMGASLAEILGVTIGDRVLLMISEANVTPAGLLPRMRRFTLAATFEIGMHEFDRGLAFIHMQDAAKLFRFGDTASGVRLRVNDLYAAPQIVRTIAEDAGGLLYINDWTKTHANFFTAIRLTKNVMFFILLLVVAVAAFNIISTLVMVVNEKQSDIAILRTLGARPGSILSIFVCQGTLIGIIGTMIGVALGILLAVNVENVVHWLEGVLGFELLPPSVYFINDLPARVIASDVILVSSMALVLAIASTLYPALRGARTQPAEALRHD
ncbi:MAG: lipoprotein-releasing ABC transporter permease subunit [Gammaproteobacteria bacterium]|nr:lipoprotein-releasing ABC transporter permease subunit [Gammaproteobacteria bacterium]